MAAYKVFFKASAEKELRGIPKEDLEKLLHRIQRLQDDPRPPGCEKLTGQERYRLRQGCCRVLYSIQDEAVTVWVIKVGHRKDIYKR